LGLGVRVAVLTSIVFCVLVGLLLQNNGIGSFSELLIEIQQIVFSTSLVFLFFLLPLIGYIFVKFEIQKFNTKQFQKIISYGIIILLASTILTTPFGVSSIYFPAVYASSDNSTISQESTIDSNSSNQINSTGNQYPPSDPILEDDADPVKLITTSNTQANSTSLGVVNNTVNSTEDATSSPDPISEIDDTSVEFTTSNSTNASNYTIAISDNLLIFSDVTYRIIADTVYNKTSLWNSIGIEDKIQLILCHQFQIQIAMIQLN